MRRVAHEKMCKQSHIEQELQTLAFLSLDPGVACPRPQEPDASGGCHGASEHGVQVGVQASSSSEQSAGVQHHSSLHRIADGVQCKHRNFSVNCSDLFSTCCTGPAPTVTAQESGADGENRTTVTVTLPGRCVPASTPQLTWLHLSVQIGFN